MTGNICGNAEENSRYPVLEMMVGHRDTFDYVQCVEYHFLQISEPPRILHRLGDLPSHP